MIGTMKGFRQDDGVGDIEAGSKAKVGTVNRPRLGVKNSEETVDQDVVQIEGSLEGWTMWEVELLNWS